MREASRRARRLASALPWIAAGIGAVLLAGVAVLLGQNLQSELDANANRARILAAGTAEAVSRRIEGIDFALMGLAARIDPRRLDDPDHRAALHAALVETRDLSRDTNAFVVLDRAGGLVATSRVPPDRTERVSLADRPLFAPIAADPAPRLSISPPYLGLLGNVRDQAIIALGRPLFDADGAFAGVVTAILPIVQGRGLLPPTDLPDSVVVILLRGDGVLLEQRPASSGLPREADVFALPEALGHADPPPTGLFRTVRASDGEAFLAAWHMVDRGRAVVLAGLKRAAVVAAWARTAVPVSLAGALLAAALVLLAVRLSRTIVRLDDALADLESREGEMRTIADSLGIVLWLRPRRLEATRYRGAAAARLTGRTIAELESRPFYWREVVTHPDDRDALQRSYRGVDLAQGWCHVYRIVARDGTVRWIEDRAIQVKAANGDGPVYGTITDITELHEARERLSRQERQIADAVRIAGLAFWRLPVDADRFEWSSESYRQFGVDPLSFQPRVDAVLAMIEPEDRQRVAETLRRVRETGESESYIYRFRRADGALRVRWSLTGVERDGAGRVIALSGVSQDITDRERMHAALTQQQLQLAEAGRAAGLGFWRLRKGSEVLEWTDEVYRQMGETRETFVPTLEALYQRILPEDREATRAAAERVWETGEPGGAVYRIRRPDGEIRYRWVSIALERDADGTPVAVSGISQDITEQRLATERLARQERLIAEAGRIARIGFYRRDLATGAIDCNDEFRRQYGLEDAEPVEFATLHARLHPDDAELQERARQRVLDNGETVTFTYRIIRPDGAVRRLRATIGLERALDGSPTAVSGLFQDVTEEVEAREQRERQQQFLEAARRIGRLNYWRLPLDGEEYTWTETLFEEYGVDPATFVPTRARVFAMIHPDDRQAVIEAGQHLRRTGEGATTTFRIIRPDGSVRWRRAVSGLERNAEGVPVALIGVTQDVTGELAGREQLERQQRYLEAARRIGHVGFYWRAIDSDTYTWTEEIYAGYGVDPASFVPTRAAVRAMAHPDDLAVIDAAAARLFETGESGAVTFRIIRPDGTVRWRRATSGLERGPDGAPIGLVGVSQDVTEEVERREQLERQQQFLDAARRIGRIGFYRRPLDGSPSTWTEEIYRDFGVDPATFTPTRDAVMAMVHPEDRDALRAWMSRVREGNETRDHTYRLIRADGQVRWRRVVAGLERRADGTPVAVVGVAQDVTEEVEAREQIAEQARRLREVGRVAHIGFYRRALDGTQMVATEEKLRQFGLPLDSGPLDVGAYRALMHPDDLPRVEATGRRIVETGESETVTFRVCRPDGTVRWIRIVAGLERDADGRKIAVTGLSQDVTEEVEAAEQLRQREKLLGDAGRVARLGFWRRRLDEETVVWSEEMYRFYGFEPGGVVPTLALIRARLHPDDVPVWQQARARLHETGENQTVTVRVRQGDGSWRWIRDSVGMERTADGVVTIYGIAQDVTAEIEATERLRHQDRLLADAGRVARLGFWGRRLDSDVVTWSDEVYRQFGFEPGSVVPTNAMITERLHPDDIALWEASRTRLRETGEAQTVTVRVRRPDGGYRWIRNASGMERGSDGMIAVFGITQDVTEEVEARERLDRQRRQLADAGRVAGLGFWRLPIGGDAFELSEAIYDQIGVDPNTFTSSVDSVLGLMPPEDQAIVRATLERVAATGEQANVVYRIRRPDGSLRHRSSSVGLERGPDGMPVALVGVSTDITERIQQEERLERAQRLNALGELTGGIAHDVNNLLSVIGLNLELVHELVADGEARELTEAALHAVGQGAKLTRGLLAFAQRQSLRPAPVPLAPLVGGLDALLRRALGGRIVLRTEVAADTPPALVDAAQLETSLVNLVLNARDAMPEGGQVTIRAGRASAEEAAAAGLAATAHVRIAVEDEGQGMAPEVLARAFEPFFTTKGAGKGTGLGLAMVYGFARQSGGEVRIDSTEGEGTTVTLWLPIAEEEAGIDVLRAADHAVLAGVRLLVVEDEAPLRALVERLCREAGMEVSAVADADAALALLRYGVRIDLLLSDIRMPGRLDGHGLAAEARALRPGLPVVLMTGFDDSVAGDVVVPQLRKPFSRADLLDALAAALRAAQATAK
ncbi:PAS domain-containing protein [Elioraea tepidiphila]|uniref:PAS domain-containing protein n=1 Tax=Elioraea tepidiphila TaxID=457934 RepID=UPI00036D7B92|nr:PAS domain-containing protein [Elioraea tepidiphila]